MPVDLERIRRAGRNSAGRLNRNRACLVARADEFRRAASSLGFRKVRQTGSHERWIHPDGRATTIRAHGGRPIGPPLFYRILDQLGITAKEFSTLR
ncbi:MAG: type II toxin-antitoxin system HicA family toxin [Bryobacteraceae bacterium]